MHAVQLAMFFVHIGNTTASSTIPTDDSGGTVMKSSQSFMLVMWISVLSVIITISSL